MNKIDKFKAELNRVFDDDLHTKQWHNYVDYAIIGLILFSTIEVFLSTYDSISQRYRNTCRQMPNLLFRLRW